MCRKVPIDKKSKVQRASGSATGRERASVSEIEDERYVYQ